MKKFPLWCLKHKLLSFLILSITICGFYTLTMFYLEAPMPVIVILDVVIVFVTLAYVNCSYAKDLQDAQKALFEECDPLLFYEVTTQAAEYTKGTSQQDLILNQTAALYYMGKHEEVIDILENLNIDKIDGTLLQSKIVYYNNLAAAYESSDQLDKAEPIFKKVRTLYNDAKPKLQQQLKNVILCVDIFESNRAGEYERSLELINARKEADKSRLNKVSIAISEADIYIKLGENEKALDCLQFAFMNGGKTFYVDLALKMINEIKSENMQ